MSYGVFNDEGMLAGEFTTAEEARAWAQNPANGCEDDKNITIDEECHDHDEHAAATCELCTEEDE